MAGRQNKVGLDYFELDCHMEEKVRLIQAEFGMKGFAVVVKLYQKIYGQRGYYCEWTQDYELLFASENGLSSGSVNEIVAACIRRDIFSEELYRKYGILTSSGVQKRYLNATSKREAVELKKEYLLISVPKNRKNVVINSISDVINSISDTRNEQSRVEKSREEKKHSCAPELHDEDQNMDEFFESIWKLYPIKKGKGQVSKTEKKVLKRIGYDHIKRCVERFVKDMEAEKRDKRYWMNGSTFFNSGYVDYLDENYDPSQIRKPRSNISGTGFNNFTPRDYDGEIERDILNAQRCRRSEPRK